MMRLMKRYITFGLIGIFVAALLLLVSIWIWQMRAGSEARSKLAAIKAKGLPTTPQEVNEFYDSLCEKPDIADDWLKLFELVRGEEIQNDYKRLIQKEELIIFPPGETWPQQPDVIRFLTKHQNVLEAIHKTLKKNGDIRFPVDYQGVLKLDLSHHGNLRGVARLLSLDADLKAHQCSGEQLVESIECMLDVTTKLDNELTTTGPFIHISIRKQAVDLVQRSLSRVAIPATASQRLKIRFSQPNSYLKKYQRGLIGDRGRLLACFSDFERLPQMNVKSDFWKGFVNSDRCHYLDSMQLGIDICDRPLPDAWQAVTTEFESRMEAMAMKWPPPILTMLLTPNVNAGIGSACRQSFYDSACYVGLAIEEYRAEHKQMPATLEELVPSHIKEVPLDPFDGQPIRYQLTDIGYKLYSVGRDVVDDGGTEYRQGSNPDFVFEVPTPFKLIDDGDNFKPSGNYSGRWEVVSSNNQPRFKAQFKNGRILVGTETEINADGSKIITEYLDGERHRRDVYSAPDPVTEFVEHLASGTFKNDEPFEGTFCEWKGDERQFIRYRNSLPDEDRN